MKVVIMKNAEEFVLMRIKRSDNFGDEVRFTN